MVAKERMCDVHTDKEVCYPCTGVRGKVLTGRLLMPSTLGDPSDKNEWKQARF
jgi:hypothetical protein